MHLSPFRKLLCTSSTGITWDDGIICIIVCGFQLVSMYTRLMLKCNTTKSGCSTRKDIPGTSLALTWLLV
ncbi:hypothetical protein BDR04DRAFT_1087624 [Suillus decipiens]|nr:hypothetical protein BDR04DRAFT_1087624 [Suillus decipiens]